MTVLEFNSRIVEERGALRSFALSLTRNMEDALDLLQDTYLKAISYRKKFQDNTNLRAWLFTIMKNTFINSYRRGQNRKRIISQGDETAINHNPLRHATNSCESHIYAKEIIRRIEKLEDDYRIPFTRHYAGYKYEEIAKEMALPLGTVKSRIFVARKMLMNDVKLMHN